MPWHDIAIKIDGPSVKDVCRHFIQYWNYVNVQLGMDQKRVLMFVGLEVEVEGEENSSYNKGNGKGYTKGNSRDKGNKSKESKGAQTTKMMKAPTIETPKPTNPLPISIRKKSITLPKQYPDFLPKESPKPPPTSTPTSTDPYPCRSSIFTVR